MTGDSPRGMTREERKVIIASSAGTVFEWYDFFLYGSLATVIGAQFFSAFPEATRNVFALLAFATGFLVRPLGAMIFGRLGDSIGRKYTFLATMLLMGFATFIVGLLPNYATIGALAPIVLISLRILQGLAVGGEYAGAVTYVSEHAPRNKRGYYTSFIQITATLGLLLSLIIILAARLYLGEQEFSAWGWRIPFLVSIVLLGISLYIRLQMQETPAFRKIKEEGRQSKAPLTEAFGQWKNLKFALMTLFGLAAGHTVIWYTSQFYVLFFLQTVLRVDMFTATVLAASALIVGTGAYIVFGALSDKVGRKPVILAGLVLAIFTLFPVFKFITATANPMLHAAQQNSPVSVIADPKDCSFQFNPTGTSKFTNSCDVARSVLARNSVNYKVDYFDGAIPANLHIGNTDIASYDAAKLAGEEATAVPAAFAKAVNEALEKLSYPVQGKENPQIVKLKKLSDVFKPQPLKLVLAMTYLIVITAMAYAPVAAAMAEMFPTRIRYTSMSVPYNIGTGWFGGLMPAAAFAISAQAGNIYAGLWYVIAVMVVGALVIFLFVPSNHQKDILTDG